MDHKKDKLGTGLDPLKGGIVVLELNHIVERRQKGKGEES
jgi:hypothetical protein